MGSHGGRIGAYLGKTAGAGGATGQFERIAVPAVLPDDETIRRLVGCAVAFSREQVAQADKGD